MEEQKGKYVLEITRGQRTYRLVFRTEEDMLNWEKAYRKSRLYMPYFLLGVGINLLLYKLGLDLSRNLLLGGFVGLAIPLASMFLFTELHYRWQYARRGGEREGKG